jgi:hypothetical protein
MSITSSKVNKKIFSSLGKLFQGNFFFFQLISGVVFYQMGFWALRRYPNWDAFWMDANSAAQIELGITTMRNRQLPEIDLYSSFGVDHTSLPQNYFGILSSFNLLGIFGISSDQIINIRAAFFLGILVFGTYLFTVQAGVNKKTSKILSPVALTIPYLWSLSSLTPFMNTLCSVPILLYLIGKVFKDGQVRYLLWLFIVQSQIIQDITSAVFVLPIIFLYALLKSLEMTHLNFQSILSRLIKTLLISLLSYSPFLIPFLEQMLSNRSYWKGLPQNISPAIDLTSYFTFVWNNGGSSLFYPSEGSGLLLYSFPIIIYFSIYSFTIRRNAKHEISKETKNLTALILLQCIIPLVIYGIPKIAVLMPSYYRGQLNLIPFLLFILGVIGFDKWLVIQNNRNIYIKIMQIFLITSSIQIVLNQLNWFNTWETEKFRIQPETSQMLSLVPNLRIHHFPGLLINLLIALILMYAVRQSKKLDQKIEENIWYQTRAILFACVTLTIILNLQMQERSFMHEWQQNIQNSDQKKDYFARWDKWKKVVSISDPNYRFIPTGLAIYGESGRNPKLIADTELNRSFQQNYVFAYRETASPFEAIVYRSLSGIDKNTNFFPPKLQNMLQAKKYLDLIGVKYIVSADIDILDSEFIFLDKYLIQNSNFIKEDSGYLSLYLYKNHKSIAYTQPCLKILDRKTIWDLMLDRTETPWTSGQVLVEDPIDAKEFACNSRLSIQQEARLIRLAGNRFKVVVAPSNQNRNLVITYAHSKNWEAIQNGVNVNIQKAYGGIMHIYIPKGASTTYFTYKNEVLRNSISYFLLFSLFILLYAFWHSAMNKSLAVRPTMHSLRVANFRRDGDI